MYPDSSSQDYSSFSDLSSDSSARSASDSDEHVLEYAARWACDNSDSQIIEAHPSGREELCTSKFCGVSGIEHSKGPYLHLGQPPRIVPKFPEGFPRIPQPYPPWEKANPPPDVWEAWANQFPTPVGPDRKMSGKRSEERQRSIDLVDGFIAHHSWIPDKDDFHPSGFKRFSLWSENWKKQREQGVMKPDFEVYW